MSAVADCLTDVDAVISIDLIRRETCNQESFFRQIVVIWPDPDNRVGYLSTLTSVYSLYNLYDMLMNIKQCLLLNASDSLP